jgi:hypothetical protein
VFFLLLQLTAHWRPDFSEDNRRLFSLWAASFWAIHPIQTQTITYIVQRMAILSTLFLLLSFCLYLQGRTAKSSHRRWACWASAGLAALFSCGSKENGFILPVLIVVFELLELARQGQFRKIFRWTLGGMLPLLLVGWLLAWKYRIPEIIQRDYQARGFTMGERLLTEARVVVFYLSQVLWPLPSRLALHHEVSLSRSLFDPPSTMAALILIAGLILVALWQLRKHPLPSFFVFWFFLNLVIESTVLPLELIFEHRVYLPSVGIAAVLVYPLFEFSRQLKQKRAWSGLLALWVIWGGLCVYWSWERNEVWKDEITLWEDNLRKYPQSDRVQNNLAAAYESVGNFPRAELAYQEAVRLNPRSALTRANLALFYLNRGRNQEAAQSLSGIPSGEMNGVAYYAMAAVEASRGNWNGAIPYLREALSHSLFFPLAQYQLGLAYVKTGQPGLARGALREFLRIWTGDPSAPQAERARLELQSLESSPAKTP